MLKSLMISVGLMFVLSTGASPAFALSVKHEPKAAKGCVPLVGLEDARAAMKRFNLAAVNAQPEEIRALGTGLFWVEKLAGNKPLRYAKSDDRPYSFRFIDARGSSRQTGGGIIISRNGKRQNGRNVAQLVHELGHFVGNNGAYAEYRAAMKGKFCIVSGYSGSRFNEQFAENFAAYVTYPALIKNKARTNAACRASYEFFSKKLFVRGDLADKCALGRLKADDYNE